MPPSRVTTGCTLSPVSPPYGSQCPPARPMGGKGFIPKMTLTSSRGVPTNLLSAPQACKIRFTAPLTPSRESNLALIPSRHNLILSQAPGHQSPGWLQGRHEREFPFPTFSRYSLVNSFPSWVGNTDLHSHSQSQKLGIVFFVPIPNPTSWELDYSFPFPIPTL